MKQTVAAASSLLVLAAAVPQGPPAGFGPFDAMPACLDSCRPTGDASTYEDMCSSGIGKVNSCIAASSCSEGDKNDAYQAIAQLCANAGATVTAKPEASWSATSGGSSWPTAWTTNSDWTAAASSWESQTTGGPWGVPGWNGHGGPFGSSGWGPWGSSGAWTTGPWTSWWGTSGCPASTWSGWTSGSWSTDAPWTTWDGCTASTTSSVVTTTVTTGGSTSVVTSTALGLNVADATNSAGQTGSTTTSGSGAVATNFAMAGSAAGVLGVVAGALLL